MTRYVALLYSVSLCQGRRVIMSELRTMASSMGLRNARTVLATGNLVFDAGRQSLSTLGEKLEQSFATRFGRSIAFILRTESDWQQLLTDNPFPQQSALDPSHVTVRIMRGPAAKAALVRIEKLRTTDELIHEVNGNVWIYFGAGIGSSRLGSALTPERMGGIGTVRNWNTVQKIAAALTT